MSARPEFPGFANGCIALVCLAFLTACGSRAPARRAGVDVDGAQLTRACAAALGVRAGAVIVMDARTGAVWALVNSRDAVETAHPVGSLFKLVTAAAALESGAISQNHLERCRGEEVIDGMPVQCWLRGGHGTLPLREAIAMSCNIYFYRVARRTPAGRILAAARAFGLGRRAGSGWPEESPGRLPAFAPPEQALRFAVGDTTEITATPLQVAALAAAVATGRKIVPHPPGRPARRGAELRCGNILPALREGMAAGARRGTSDALANLGYPAAGKTGTAPTGVPGRTHAWFAGFTPVESPEAVVVVFLEQGRGATDAVPIARQAMIAYYESKRERR